MPTPGRTRWRIMALTLGLAAAACSGGGTSAPTGDDLGLGAGETVVQFEGAAKLRLGATLALPEKAAKGPVPAALVVPDIARNDRNGPIDVVPTDPLYRDISKALTGAGIAALRYDCRSMGTSKLDPGQQPTFDDMVTDAHEAVSFLAQRGGIDPGGLALVGHGLGGIVALRLAATDSRIRSVVLVSTPGRPLVDVLAGSFAASNGQESADSLHTVVDHLLATGSLPERSTIRPEHQPLFPSGQDAVLKAVYGLDPAAEASKVKVPVLVVTGSRSDTVLPADGDRLAGVLPSATAVTVDASATLQQVVEALPQSFDPNDHRAHGGGRPPDTATRDQGGVDRITGFLSSKLAGPRQ